MEHSRRRQHDLLKYLNLSVFRLSRFQPNFVDRNPRGLPYDVFEKKSASDTICSSAIVFLKWIYNILQLINLKQNSYEYILKFTIVSISRNTESKVYCCINKKGGQESHIFLRYRGAYQRGIWNNLHVSFTWKFNNHTVLYLKFCYTEYLNRIYAMRSKVSLHFILVSTSFSHRRRLNNLKISEPSSK